MQEEHSEYSENDWPGGPDNGIFMLSEQKNSAPPLREKRCLKWRICLFYRSTLAQSVMPISAFAQAS